MTEKTQLVLRKEEEGQVVFGELRIDANRLKARKEQENSFVRTNSRAETIFILDANINHLCEDHIEILLDATSVKQIRRVELALSFYVAVEGEENLTHQQDTLHITDESCALRVTKFKANKTGKLVLQVGVLEENQIAEKVIYTDIDVTEGQVVDVDGIVTKSTQGDCTAVQYKFISEDCVLGELSVDVRDALTGVKVASPLVNLAPDIKDILAKLIQKLPAKYNFERYGLFYQVLKYLTPHLSVGTLKLSEQLNKLHDAMPDFYDGRRHKHEGKFIQLLKLISIDLAELPVYEDKTNMLNLLLASKEGEVKEVKPTLTSFSIKNKGVSKKSKKHPGLVLEVTEGKCEGEFTATKSGNLLLTITDWYEYTHEFNLNVQVGDLVKIVVETELLKYIKGHATSKITLTTESVCIEEFVTFKVTEI